VFYTYLLNKINVFAYAFYHINLLSTIVMLETLSANYVLYHHIKFCSIHTNT